MKFFEALRKKIAASNRSYRENAAELGYYGKDLYNWANENTEPDVTVKWRLWHHFGLGECGVDKEEILDGYGE